MRTQIVFFDTRTDTKKKFVTVKTTIKLRDYTNKQGEAQLYLHVSCDGRERIPLNIYVKPKYWVKEKEMLRGPDEEVADMNLLINQVKKKVHEIKVMFRLSDKVLTLTNFVEEFKNDLPRTNFVNFYKTVLDDRKGSIESSTYIKEKAVYNKLKAFQPEIMFTDLDLKFFLKYRKHLHDKGNMASTRNANIKIIKKYIRFALKNGARIPIDVDDIKVGSTLGERNYLNGKEVKKCHKYYHSEFIIPSHKIVLGYFLFSCFTGMRISDVLNSERKTLLKGHFTYKQVKTKKNHVMELNDTAVKIVKGCEDLFIKKYSEKHINDTLKTILGNLGITKHITFHCARHTFGTNYILLGGDIKRLKVLMNHSKISDTEIYINMAEMERNAKADLMDSLIDEG